jgi:hypothetical protein
MKRKLLGKLPWIALAALFIVWPILASSPWVQAQMQALELIGVRPFIRMQGTEVGGQVYEVREIAGTLSIANVSTATSQTMPGILYSVGNGTTGCTAVPGDDPILTYTLPAGHLSANGKGIKIEAWGITAANGNNKTVNLVVGGTTLVSSGVLPANNLSWAVEGTYIRTAAAVEDSVGLYGNSTPITVGPTRAVGADNTANAIVVQVTGNCATAANDIVGRGMVVWAVN